MALLWCSFMEAVTPGHDQLGQGGSGHHNCMVGGSLLSCKPVEGHIRGHAHGLALSTEGSQVIPM